MTGQVTLARPVLLPVSLEQEPGESFRRQLAALVELSEGLVEWRPAAWVGDPVADDVTAVVVPDMSGLAYRLLEELRRIPVPLLVVTSEFGTVSMWDWEIRDYLRRRGVDTVAPTSREELVDVLRGLAVRADPAPVADARLPRRPRRRHAARHLQALLLVGGGVRRRPGAAARGDRRAALLARAGGAGRRRSPRPAWSRRTSGSPPAPTVGLSWRARAEALRLYLALADELDETPDVIAAGINCLNESATSPTTPCLAWNLLFEERGLIWGCEADLTSMMTEFLTWQTLRAPVMMTNLYPFLMGDAALKHEKIPYFPAVAERPAEPHPRRRTAGSSAWCPSRSRLVVGAAAGAGDRRPERPRARRPDGRGGHDDRQAHLRPWTP